MQNPDIRNKVGEYFLSKYGVRHPSMLLEFEKKKQDTNIERYGVPHQMHISDNILKIKSSKLEKYGNENYNNIKKNKETCLERYGVNNVMKVEEIFNRQKSSSFSKNEINNLIYQSTYELDFIKKCLSMNIRIENGPSIDYAFDGKDHKYYSDFYLPEYNLVCEIKSNYIYNMEVDINERKKASSIKNGYNFLFIIDKNYTEFEKILIR